MQSDDFEQDVIQTRFGQQHTKYTAAGLDDDIPDDVYAFDDNDSEPGLQSQYPTESSLKPRPSLKSR